MPWKNRSLLRNNKNEPVPQHWGGNDWEVSGVDNPLPTANHVMTEGGIWVPQRGSDDGSVNTQVTGSKVEYETLLDAVSVSANDSRTVTIPNQSSLDCDEIWFLVSIDKYPWTIEFRSFNTNAVNRHSLFPAPVNIENTFSISNPYIALYHRLIQIKGSNDFSPGNIIEAKANIMPYNAGPNLTGIIINESEDTATVTLRAVKIWR